MRVSQQQARIWSRGRDETIEYHIDNVGRREVVCRIAADVPRHVMRAEPAERLQRLPAERRATVTWTLTGLVRGQVAIAGLHCECRSRLGLWQVAVRRGDAHIIHVHPDLKQLNEYALLARADRLDLIGVRRIRRTGGDTEFERLRDFQNDDPLNRVDWKATARRDQLTVREYQTNQSQVINLVIDHGRLMQTRVALCGSGARSDGDDEERSRTMLDHAIDAALMLAFVALGQNDRVGLLSFADRVGRRVPARSGPRRLNELIHAVHDLMPAATLSRPDEALLHVARHERKRSLVVIITHVQDQVGADLLIRHAATLVGRHLPLVVLLRDDSVFAAAPQRDQEFAHDDAAFWRAGAAAAVLNERQQAIEKLKNAGCLVIDTAPGELTPNLVSRYLDIKARSLL